jgi:hypothetical protein
MKQRNNLFPLNDALRVCAGILALILIFLSYLADTHIQTGISYYLQKNFFLFSMCLGGILLILGLFTRVAAMTMIIGVWAGYFTQLLGSSLLIPVSFTLVLLGVSVRGAGYYTIQNLFSERKNS